jgi:peptidoglycan/xylan/chitin deacetylase (PgdA/CDA1 family)
MTKVYFTIDTEYEFGFAARHGLAARAENFARSIRGATPAAEAGTFHQMDVFERHGLKAVFFVDPMPALVWGTGAIAEVVEPILERGHDVQLHIHTEWLALAGEASPLPGRTGRNIKDFDLDEQVRLIGWASDALVAAGAPRPVAFRAGNYGANDDTLRALAQLGIACDSSHPPGIADSACAIGLGAEDRRPVERLGVTEVPIGCIADGAGLRHAQLTALSARELLAAIRHARDNGIADFTLVSHSFELLSRDRSRINRVLTRRFERLCAALKRMPGVETATYRDALPAAEPPAPCPLLPPNPLRKGARMLEQALGNALYGAG